MSSKIQNARNVGPLSFPMTKCALWNHDKKGNPIDIHITHSRSVQIQVDRKVLQLVQRYSEETSGTSYHCLLTGSIVSDSENNGIKLIIDRFEPRHEDNQGLITPVLIPGDICIPCTVYTDPDCNQGYMSEHIAALKYLTHRCTTNEKIEVTNFFTIKAHAWCLIDRKLDIDIDFITLKAQFQATPINSIPIVQTALSKNLTGPMNIGELQGQAKMGFLSMDATRKLVFILQSDPKIQTMKVVGIWVTGIKDIHDPYVWCSCLRYMYTDWIHERVCSPPEPFLLVLISPLHVKPQFFECNTDDKTSKMSFEYDTCSAKLDFSKNYSTEPIRLDLSEAQNGAKLQAFNSAAQELCTAIPERDTFVDEPVMDDVVPRSSPSPHDSSAQAAQPLVPEVSFLFDDMKGNHQQLQSVPMTYQDFRRSENEMPGKRMIEKQTNEMPRKPLQSRDMNVYPGPQKQQGKKPSVQNQGYSENDMWYGQMMPPEKENPQKIMQHHSYDQGYDEWDRPMFVENGNVHNMSYPPGYNGQYRVSVPYQQCQPPVQNQRYQQPYQRARHPMNMMRGPINGPMNMQHRGQFRPQGMRPNFQPQFRPHVMPSNVQTQPIQQNSRQAVVPQRPPVRPTLHIPRSLPNDVQVSSVPCISQAQAPTIPYSGKPDSQSAPNSPITTAPATTTAPASAPQSPATDNPFASLPAPEVYKLLMEQDAQLKALQAQLKRLLTQNEPVIETKQSCVAGTNTSLAYTRGESDETVTSTSSCNDSCERDNCCNEPGCQECNLSGQEMSSIEQPCDDYFNSEHIDSMSFSAVQMQTLENNTVESSMSEMIVDIPSYRSDDSFSNASCHENCSQVIESVSMYENEQHINMPMPPMPEEQICSEETSASEEQPPDQQFYCNLLGNIRDLLQGNNTFNESGNKSDLTAAFNLSSSSATSEDVAKATLEHLRKLGIEIPETNVNDTYSLNQTLVSVEAAVMQKINYVSMFFDDNGDTDISMQVNSLAMKYLNDDQLSTMAKISSAARSNVTNRVNRNNMLHQVLNKSATPNESLYGMHSTDMSFATRKYMDKYGLMGKKNVFGDISEAPETTIDSVESLQIPTLWGNDSKKESFYEPIEHQYGSKKDSFYEPKEHQYTPEKDCQDCQCCSDIDSTTCVSTVPTTSTVINPNFKPNFPVITPLRRTDRLSVSRVTDPCMTCRDAVECSCFSDVHPRRHSFPRSQDFEGDSELSSSEIGIEKEKEFVKSSTPKEKTGKVIRKISTSKQDIRVFDKSNDTDSSSGSDGLDRKPVKDKPVKDKGFRVFDKPSREANKEPYPIKSDSEISIKSPDKEKKNFKILDIRRLKQLPKLL